MKQSEVRDQRSEVSRRTAFTLVELLAVIAIMAILIVVAMPAFNTLKQRGLKNAVPGLTSTLRLARQYAVTHRRNVWVVFPAQDGITTYQGSQVKFALRSYAVMEGDTLTGSTNYISEWKFLPDGAYFEGYTPNYIWRTNGIFYESGQRRIPPAMFSFPISGDPPRRMAAVLFKANGRGYAYTGTKWSDFSTSEISVVPATVAVNTNLGTISSFFSPTNSQRILVWVRNQTGQLSVFLNED